MPDGARVKVRGTIDRTDPANPVFTVKNLKYHEVVTKVTPAALAHAEPRPAALSAAPAASRRASAAARV